MRLNRIETKKKKLLSCGDKHCIEIQENNINLYLIFYILKNLRPETSKTIHIAREMTRIFSMAQGD